MDRGTVVYVSGAFSHLIGHRQIQRQLFSAIAAKSVPHALLFAGPEGVGKSCYGRALAAALVASVGSPQHAKALAGSHPDIHEYSPEGKGGVHSIEAMRQLAEEAYLAPYEGHSKAFIIHAAERMQLYSANALLKVFEEPPLDTLIVLVSSEPILLLPTIRSRCCCLSFGLLESSEIAEWLVNSRSCERERALLLAAQGRGSLARTSQLLVKGEEPFLTALIPILVQGRFPHYAALCAAVRDLADKVAIAPSAMEEGELTALQRQRMEKENSGIAALQSAVEVKELFTEIAAWYRDMALLYYRGPQTALWHTRHREALMQAIQRGQCISIDCVIAAIEEASLALQRSNPLQHVLEVLFLRLRFL